MEYRKVIADGAPSARPADNGLGQARRQVDAQARQNAAVLTGVAGKPRPMLEERAGRWWDIAAKVKATNRIKD